LRGQYLKRHCPGSSECLILGQNRREILQFFNGFNFDYAEKILTPIGENSINGFVHEIEFKHRDYVSYAVLKTSKKAASDNLIYEYFMGLFINKVNAYLPTFLETYGLYTCSPDFHDKLDSRQPVPFDKEIVPLVQTNSEIIKRACTAPLYNQLLIQHVKNAETFYSKIKDTEFLKNEMCHVLFQVYAALYSLRWKFTHFDLHANNILLQKPFPDGVIEFHYDDIVFHSPYLVKIIDYGRAETRNSLSVINEVCITPECEPECGKYMGFRRLKGLDDTTDVKLLNRFANKLPQRLLDHIPEELMNVFKTETLAECYQSFVFMLRDRPLSTQKINGVLKIDTSLKTPFQWKIE